jgi:hypothetical protein
MSKITQSFFFLSQPGRIPYPPHPGQIGLHAVEQPLIRRDQIDAFLLGQGKVTGVVGGTGIDVAIMCDSVIMRRRANDGGCPATETPQGQ